jgi:mannose-6-phosphate isomerase
LKTGAILRLHNAVRSYEWGSRTAIAEILGEPPSREPQAELWMGAHPRAPSRVRGDEDEIPLDAWIARDPEAALGAEVVVRFGATLPFLLKILAANRPLSIQAHPDRAQARAGFEREERAGIPRDAPGRSYPDPNPKPELICALTPFRALNRFRDPAEIALAFARIGAPELAAELAGPGPSLSSFLASLLGQSASERQRLLGWATDWAREAAGEDDAAHWVGELARHYPGDIGILAPLFLNLIELAPGEAMFLPPGELHAYLGGVGLELMGSSDNVLRGGLTSKHVDVPELLAALADRSGPVERLRPEPRSRNESVYRTPSPEFALSVIDTRTGGPFEARADHGVEILLCSAGACEVAAAGHPSLALARGDSAFVPACAPGYRISGAAVVHRASIPR